MGFKELSLSLGNERSITIATSASESPLRIAVLYATALRERT